MNKNLAALLGGGIFGFGLVLSGMTNPDKVLAFLTLGPAWDMSLIFVLGGAVTVAFIGYRLVGGRAAPLFDNAFHAPTANDMDKAPVFGAVLFGLGWGVAGYCPGPAIVGAITLDPRAMVFIVGFILGMGLYQLSRQQPAKLTA